MPIKQASRTRTRNPYAPVSVKGFLRAQLVNAKTGAIEGDSGYVPNAVTAEGFQNYIVANVGSNVAGVTAKQIAYLQLASQTAAPTSSQQSATGEFEARKTTSNSFVANGTLRATASWATNEATQSNLGAIAFYNTSSAGTCASVATFATSAKTTNQTLNVTYEWRFS